MLTSCGAEILKVMNKLFSARDCSGNTIRLKPSFVKKLLLILLFLNWHGISLAQDTANELLFAMMDSARAINGFTSVIKKTERINGKLITQESMVKVKRNPYLLYIRQLKPKAGVEILCNVACEKAIVNTNGFPWLSLTLDPFGQIMRKNQHHTVHDTGFDLLVRILEFELQGENPNRCISYDADYSWDSKKFYRIQLVNEDFKYTNYRVEAGQDINTIAHELNVNGYAILEVNDECNSYEDVKPGQRIRVPNKYAYKIILLIDKQTLLPVIITIYDDKGLFEEYSYNHFELNPTFANNEFEEDFSEYDF